ncbi:MAG: glycosyltransferase family 39 protein [Chloroflexi bacterium]|nr:glycosyltransferase family 39 protein [Chloroflexota bacterium]
MKRQDDPENKKLEAVYRDGTIHPLEPLALPEETPLWVTVDLRVDTAIPANTAPPQLHTAVTWLGQLLRQPAWILFALSLLVYAFTRFWRIADYPIYFFSDEAIQSLSASDLINNGFRDADGQLLPAYFKNFQVYNLSLSVYLQLLPVTLFGLSVTATRAVSALISLLGVTAVALTLKQIFQTRYWWTAVLLLAAMPAWFLHSRTAFETVLMVSFYALFLYFYLLYRYRHPAYIYAAMFFAAASFYAYSNGQAIIALLVLLLALSDGRYHWQQARDMIARRRWVTAVSLIAFALLLLAPYLRFRLTYPTDLAYHLRSLNSYWFQQDLTLGQKMGLFAQRYVYGLSPGYWFWPNTHDLERHRMLGYFGHLRPETLPLLLIGLVICLRQWRASSHRAVLLALLAVPVGAANVDIAITRVLALVAPAAILMALGLDWLLTRFKAKWQPALALATFLTLSWVSVGLLADALNRGPLWFPNYGMFGMQYGATQLFDIIPEILAENPQTIVLLTPTWANGTDLFPRFFLPPEQLFRVQTLNVDGFILNKQGLTDDMLFIMTPEEYGRAQQSGKFKEIAIEREFSYPDGSPGFYFARLAYVADVDAIFAAERAERQKPVEDMVLINGQMVAARHSRLDSGSLPSMFDNDTFTLGRVMEANPAFVELTFPQPWALRGLAGDFGTMDFALTVTLYADDTAVPVVYRQEYRGLEADPHIELPFPQGPPQVVRMHIEVQDLNGGETTKIHIRELTPLLATEGG